MDDRVWKNLSIVLGVVCALLIGVAGALMIVGHRGSAGASPSPSSISDAGPTPTDDTSALTPLPSEVPASGGAPASGSASASPGTFPMANIVFNGLMLDAATDKSGNPRTFTFQTDGVGALNMSITKNSVGGSTKMCVKVDASAFNCQIGALPKFTKAYTDTPHSLWTVTIVGYGSSKPTVDLSLTFPTAAPKVTMSHGRLQGSTTAKVPEALNGFTATFKPRAGGGLNVQASWTAITADVNMTLSDVTTPPSVKLDDRTYSAATYINPPYTYTVDSTKTYLLKLRNQSADSQRPDLTVQISFP